MLATQTAETAVDPKEVIQWIKKKLASSLKALQVRYVTSDDVITSDDADANTLCCALEAVFVHGLKAKHLKADSSRRGKRFNGRCKMPQPAFWTLLKTITHRDVITELEQLNFINTDVGRCRAWLRLALNECLTECFLMLLLRDRSVLEDYYQPVALLLDVEEVEVILSYVQGLTSLCFELSYKSAVLNEWTLTPLSLAGLCSSPELQMDSLIPAESQVTRKKSWDSMSRSSGSDDTDTQHAGLLTNTNNGQSSKSGSSTVSLDTNGSPQLSSSFGSDCPAKCSDSKSPDKSEELLSCDSDPAPGNTEESETSLLKPQDENRTVQQTFGSSAVPPSSTHQFTNSLLEAPQWSSQFYRQSSPPARITVTEEFPPDPQLIASRNEALLAVTSVQVAKTKKEISPPNNTGLRLTNDGSFSRTDEDSKSLSGKLCTEGVLNENDHEPYHDAKKCCISPSTTLPKSTSWISEDDLHIPMQIEQTHDNVPTRILDAGTLKEQSATAASNVKPKSTQALKPSSGPQSKSYSVVHRRQMGLSNPFAGRLMVGHLERRGALGLWKEFFCELLPFEFRLREEDRTTFENCSLLRCKLIGKVHSEGRFEVVFSDKKLYLRAACSNEAQYWVERLREALQNCRPQQEEPWEVLQFPDSSETTDNNVSTGSSHTEETPDEVVYNWTSTLPAEPEAVKESVLYMRQGRVWRSFVFSLSCEALQCFKVRNDEKVLYRSYGIETVRDIIPDTSLGGPAFFRVLTSKASVKLQAENAEESKSWRQIMRCVLESFLETSENTVRNGNGLDWTTEMLLKYPEKDRVLLQSLTVIPTEKGLDSQNFKCAACSRQIGFSFGKSKLCAFSGLYYCDSCHQDEESIIPSRIIHNWDLNKRTVCRPVSKLLNQIRNEPLINMKSANISLYDHVKDLSRITRSREQLKLLGEYLFACRSGALQEMSKRLDYRNYLLESPFIFSVTDLQQISEGIYQLFLQSVVQFASNHIYKCELCSQLGFICEICNKNDVVFPFEFDTTKRCKDCKTVFHRKCKLGAKSCPRCVRRKYFRSKTPPNL